MLSNSADYIPSHPASQCLEAFHPAQPLMFQDGFIASCCMRSNLLLQGQAIHQFSLPAVNTNRKACYLQVSYNAVMSWLAGGYKIIAKNNPVSQQISLLWYQLIKQDLQFSHQDCNHLCSPIVRNQFYRWCSWVPSLPSWDFPGPLLSGHSSSACLPQATLALSPSGHALLQLCLPQGVHRWFGSRPQWPPCSSCGWCACSRVQSLEIQWKFTQIRS